MSGMGRRRCDKLVVTAMFQVPQARQIASVAFVLALTMHAAAQSVDPRSAAPQGPRTGMIVGQVVDATTGASAPEAIVRLSMPRFAMDPAAPGGRVMADGEGRFFFADLPAGEYYLDATKEGYAPGRFGQRRILSQAQLLSLREGERRTDVTLRVWKYAVIGGTVVDEAGEPVVGVAVRALVRRIVAGRPQYGNQPYLVPSTLTDDRGIFRLPRIEPGTYVVVAPSTQATVPVSLMTSMDAYALRLALFSAAVTEAPPLGDPRTQQTGDFVLVTMNSVQIPPPPSSPQRMEVYRTAYYPAATTAATATPIAIGAGEERTDLTLTLRPAPAVSVSGRLIGPDGSPPPTTAIRLAGEAMRDITTPPLPSGPAEVGFDTAAALSDAAGRFMLLGVPPGDYELMHANQFLASDSPGRSPYWLSQRITVGTRDVSDLVVEVKSPLRVEGRVEFRGATGVQPLTRNVGLTFESPTGEPRQFFISVRAGTSTFATRAAAGRYIVRGSMSGPTSEAAVMESVTLDGKDITDRAFDLSADTTSLVVTFTDRRSKVSGVVKDARGAASPNAAVLVFPVDRERWMGYGASPRTLASVVTSQDGSYTFRHLPPGEYYAIAVNDDDAVDWQDPRTLETLAVQATRLTVAAGVPKTLDLIVKTIR